MEARVLADAYHDNYLKYADVETVPFWQSIGARDSVKATPAYVDNTGTLVTSTAQTVEPVFGLIFDRDAMGMTILDRRVLSTPVNESGLYRNRKTGTRLLITAGLGVTFIRRRIFCPPEAVIIDLAAE